MQKRLGRPSYANITATLALVVALGGTSYAAVKIPNNSVGSQQIKKDAVKSSDVKNDGLKGKDIKESTLATVPSADQLGGKTLRGLSQWAVVDSAGLLVSSSGGVASTRIAEGRYRVTFASAITACGINANAGSSAPASNATNFADRLVMVGQSTTGANDVQVETVRDDGVTQDNPFFLTVQC